jgi:hypothetical protein
MEQLVLNMLEMEQQLRIWHWQTKLFSRHSAYGATYGALGDLIDSFMEAYMGKYGRIKVTGPIQLENLNQEAEQKVESYVEFLLSLNQSLDAANDSDLLNIRDEMLGLMNKLKYLLTLK